MKAAVLLGLMAAICVASAIQLAAADSQPRPDLGAAVGVVQDGNILYVLTFAFVGGDAIHAWNVTDDGVVPVASHQFGLGDAAWGDSLGYVHFDMDGVRHAVVAAVGGPPVVVSVGDVEPYVAGDDHRKSGSSIAVRGDNDGLVVRQVWWTFPVYNGTTYHFQDVDEPPVEIQEIIPAGRGNDPTMTVVRIDGQNYAVVNTIGGPPVLADNMEAAALGLGDITDMTPQDYLRWDRPARLLSVEIDASAEVGIYRDGAGMVYAAVSAGDAIRVYDITNPPDRREVVPAGNGTAAALLSGMVRADVGAGVVHAALNHPGRAGLDVPDRFRLGDAAPRLDPAGTWAVMAAADGGIILAETDPNTEVAVVRDISGIWAVERDGGWETVYSGASGGAYSGYWERVVFGDPGVRVYDMADPAFPMQVDRDVPPAAIPAFGDAGRAVTAEIGGAAWALVPVREDIVDGPVMQVGSVYGGEHGRAATWVSVGVRNVHYEPLTISIDRLSIGDLVLEQYHTYSGFEASSFGDVRLRGPTSYGFVGPTDAYGATLGLTVERVGGSITDVGAVHVVYAVPELDVAYAFVEVDTFPGNLNVLHLEPGESGEFKVTFWDPCHESTEGQIPVDGGCGPWDYNLDTGELDLPHNVLALQPIEVTLVAEGYPQWAVTVSD